MKKVILSIVALLVVFCGITATPAFSAPPVVKTVPWVTSNPLIPHDTWTGKTIRLKGTSDVQGSNIHYAWDFGDGSPVATGTVTNKYAIEASHAYTGLDGTVFTARLTVENTTTGETGSKTYLVAIRIKTLAVEANVAIDEGLWYLHKNQIRTTSGGVDYGYWSTYGYYSETAANINAFEVNGHKENGDATNPYTETVQRGMRQIFTYLTTEVISMQSAGNPDGNGNGYGIRVNQVDYVYQGGMFIDAIIASGTPAAVTSTGQAPSGANPGVNGRTYMDIVQDMVDSYAYGQYDSTTYGGGWRYSWGDFPDNSACQWAAIGMIPAERNWGAVVPGWVKSMNLIWLTYSQASNGVFGYTNTSPIWGPFATTPSGMVQLVLDGVGRGNTKWDHAETYIRDNFGNGGGATTNIKEYYYGLFSLVKSLRLQTPPITMLHSASAGVSDIDWYNAEVSSGAPTDGVARTLVNHQLADGHWSGHYYYYLQDPYHTAWAILMLGQTLFESGAPVAVADATPNPGVAGQTIIISGSSSFHQDPTKSIDSWDWDLDNNGICDDASGPTISHSWLAVGDYPVKLCVSDNGSPEKFASTIVTVRITTPPIAPTANAGGPYNFCPGTKPWYLDGRGSVNPDEGQHEIGHPGDTIQTYAWELNGNASYNDAFGSQPDVTAFFTGAGVGSYLIQLKVTDTTSASFPSSGMGDLSDTDTAEVKVKSSTDPACVCVSNLSARPKLNKVELRWTPRAGAISYNVYRGTSNGGPYLKIASVAGTSGFYLNQGLVTGTTYYYVVREAALNGDELCQSNQASAVVTTR